MMKPAALTTALLALVSATHANQAKGEAVGDIIYRNSFEIPCLNLPAPFRQGTNSSYFTGLGYQFGSPHDWAYGATGNSFNSNGSLQWVNVRVYSFQSPDPNNLPPGIMASGTLRSAVATGGIAMSISDQCGNFNVPRECRMVASDFTRWTTTGEAGKCPLNPNQTYYLNVAWFELSTYLANPSNPAASVVSTCPQSSCGFSFRSTH